VKLDKNMDNSIKTDFVSEEDVLTPLEEQNRLLRRNLEVSQESLEKIEKIKAYIKWQKIWSTVQTLIILAPIVAGFLYLPNFIKQYIDHVLK